MTDHAPKPTKEQYIEAVAANSARLAEVARGALREPVPTCPGWSVATLVGHLGRVQHFWTVQLGAKSTKMTEPTGAIYDGYPGLAGWNEAAQAPNGTTDLDAIPDGLVDWLEGATAALVAALRAADPADVAWHWSGEHTAGQTIRMQAVEATIHRWDVENVRGMTTPIDPLIARDGVDHHYEVMVPHGRRWLNPAKGEGETYHLHRTDGPGEWLIRFDGDTVDVRHEHAKGDIALRGTAEQLFLWVWGRLPADRLEVFGDRALIDRYRALVPPD